MRIAVISDIHEDVLSLKKAFKKIEKNRIDEIVCLGDISGFSVPNFSYFKSRNAHECLHLIRQNCKTILIGNHDMHAAKIIPGNCAFFDFPENWYQLDYFQRVRLAGDTVWLHELVDLDPIYTHDDIEFLHTLSDVEEINTPIGTILLSHYVYPNTCGFKSEFYTYLGDFEEHFSFMEMKKCRIGFTGHNHTRGFFMTTPKRIKQYRYKTKQMPDENICIGVPPITNNGGKSGFCIFDTDANTIQAIRL